MKRFMMGLLVCVGMAVSFDVCAQSKEYVIAQSVIKKLKSGEGHFKSPEAEASFQRYVEKYAPDLMPALQAILEPASVAVGREDSWWQKNVWKSKERRRIENTLSRLESGSEVMEEDQEAEFKKYVAQYAPDLMPKLDAVLYPITFNARMRESTPATSADQVRKSAYQRAQEYAQGRYESMKQWYKDNPKAASALKKVAVGAAVAGGVYAVSPKLQLDRAKVQQISRWINSATDDEFVQGWDARSSSLQAIRSYYADSAPGSRGARLREELDFLMNNGAERLKHIAEQEMIESDRKIFDLGDDEFKSLWPEAERGLVFMLNDYHDMLRMPEYQHPRRLRAAVEIYNKGRNRYLSLVNPAESGRRER